MPDKYNVNQFNRDQNYELQIKNRGKRTGITYEFQEDLQKYIDEGIFVDELNDGFSIKEKRNLAETFLEIHKEKGYNTNFGKMKKDTKFSYTADEYIRLAKAAGYVLKELTPEEEAVLRRQIEKSAEELSNAEIETNPVVTPAEETPLTIVPTEPVPIAPDMTPDLTIKPLDIKPVTPTNEPEAEDDPFKLSENDPVFAEIEVERVNIDELPGLEETDEDTAPAQQRLPKSFLKRHGINPKDFDNLSFQDKARLYNEFAEGVRGIEKAERKAHRRPLLTRIFGGKKPEDA